MNVLSLFNGMGCIWLALDDLLIDVDKRYSSEMDKFANQVNDKNYPDTIQLGDVTKVKGEDLEQIDLLVGGSPCQGFSFAGKQLNFEDPRSKLFFEFVRLLEETKPKYFLLENVKMKKEYEQVITDLLGVEPIEINSSLVSAQNRKRLYWTNIPGVTQPEDKGVLLKDIIERDFFDRDKSYCLDANYYKGGNLKQYFEKNRRQIVFDQEPQTLSVLKKDPARLAYKKAALQLRGLDKKSNCLTTSGQNLSNSGATNLMYIKNGVTGFRSLTPIECERLQTVPDNYTDCVSNTQRYKMLGNGWTVSVISHILSFMEC